MIREKNYESNHILIIHREKNSFQNFNKYFNTEISRKYGRSEIFLVLLARFFFVKVLAVL